MAFKYFSFFNHVFDVRRLSSLNMLEFHFLCVNLLPDINQREFSIYYDNPLMIITPLQVLPRIQKLCMATVTLSVRVSCLVCVGRLVPCLDKWLVYDVVVPFLIQLPSKEAPVVMAAVGTCDFVHVSHFSFR